MHDRNETGGIAAAYDSKPQAPKRELPSAIIRLEQLCERVAATDSDVRTLVARSVGFMDQPAREAIGRAGSDGSTPPSMPEAKQLHAMITALESLFGGLVNSLAQMQRL